MTFLEAMQTTYGNVSQTEATLAVLGLRFGLDADGVRHALEAGQSATGRLFAKRLRSGRWAVFLKGE